ncbi:MAG: DUF1311 domain-containing protein [Alphaproteobacteria bacterium]|nr:DUF1311 domain-containing protein [Alphaproteobacteria bacterium]
MTLRLIILFAFTLFAVPAQAQELNFNIQKTAICLDTSETEAQRKVCIGEAASACMEATPGGFSTLGMNGCMDREVAWWDGQLNAAYTSLMTREKADDAQNAADGYPAPSKAKALRAMQRAWITYRDTTCAYSASQFGNGTGAGTAYVGCLLQITGEQALFLEASKRDY